MRRRFLSVGFSLVVLVAFALAGGCKKQEPGDEFLRLSNVGKAQLDRGDGSAATATFEKALQQNPSHPDAKLNLANALLLVDRNAEALKLAQSVIAQEPGSAPAYYLAGIAANRLRDFTNAVKYLTEAKQIDITVNPVSFQLGFAYEGMTNYDAAIEQYEEVEKFAPDYPGIHYRLAQIYLRTQRQDDSTKEMEQHRQWLAQHPNQSLTVAALERSKYTQARIPFTLEQPDAKGIPVQFADVSSTAFSHKFAGPVGTIDFAHDGKNHLLVRDNNSFRILVNQQGTFRTNGQAFPFTNGGVYSRWLVADLNKDTVPDALVIGDRGVHLYKFTTNGTATETTAFAGLKDFAARDAIFADLNFRSDLDILAVGTNGELKVMSNLQNMYFVDTTTNLPVLPGTGAAPALTDRSAALRGFAVDDWNGDELMDMFIAQSAGPPLLLLHRRGGGFTNATVAWPQGSVIAVGDLNNDSRPDLAIALKDRIDVYFGGDEKLHSTIPAAGLAPHELKLIDYDNDGWLDLFALGDGLRVWRNAGVNGFTEKTRDAGLDKVAGRVDSIAAADFDDDGDTDLVVGLPDGVHLFRNEGGNANRQLRLALRGTRSNSSAIGTRVDVSAAGLRLSRRVNSLPVEVGVGKHDRVDAVTAQWIEITTTQEEVDTKKHATLTLVEPMMNTGSCPFLYAWDGERFRFVTDILGSAPLGLPCAPGKYIEADTEEMVTLGDEARFRPRNGSYVVQITEELREVLYLDEVKLVVVDHEPGTEVHTTDKMIARRPAGGFPRGEIVTLKNRLPLLRATTHQQEDVTGALAEADGRLVSPRLREPQYRGLTVPHSITLDFGPLDSTKPLVLALTGWLRFGGATANIAASSRPDFPFPFVTIDAEAPSRTIGGSNTAATAWVQVDVEPAAPSGKTKTILFDLADKLPAGARRLRVSAAFEIHWDRAALFEKATVNNSVVTKLLPNRTHLHARGLSEYAALPWNQPITPVYDLLRKNVPWRVTPSGWATRYGAVDELVRERDNALVTIADGDELTAEFKAASLPSKTDGMIRDFFLFTSGWDKDSDYHVETGTTIEPLPWHGLNDQLYGAEARPKFTNDGWIQKYNTRWVGPRLLTSRPGLGRELK